MAVFTTIVVLIVVFIILWIIPPFRNWLIDLYENNIVIHAIGSAFLAIFGKH